MSWHRFYCQWLRRAFSKPWSCVQALSFILAILFGVLAWRYPHWGGTLNILLWAVSLGVFGATSLVGFMLAPYYIYKDEERYKCKLAKELEDSVAKLPSIMTNLQKENNGTDFYLEVKNTGGEAIFDAEIRVLEGDSRLRQDQRLIAYWEKGGMRSKGQTDRIRIGAVVNTDIGVGAAFKNRLYYYDGQNSGLAYVESEPYLVLHGITLPDDLSIKPKWKIQFIISSCPSMKDGVVSKSFEFELERFDEI